MSGLSPGSTTGGRGDRSGQVLGGQVGMSDVFVYCDRSGQVLGGQAGMSDVFVYCDRSGQVLGDERLFPI
eukprot:6742314-Prymnesium_polylepis.1